ncbi:MAG: hypothetical protein LBP26_02355 [Clostridiales bacterium]|jgi:hypothetical protein|nr:hypothetical protein [Clostridiales bacterium]
MSEKVKKVKRIKADANKGVLKKRLLIIASAVLAALVATCFILGFVRAKAFEPLSGREYVRILSGGQAAGSLLVDNETRDADATRDQYEVNKLLSAGLKKSRYSLLRGVLEGVWSNSYKFETEKEEYKNAKGKTKTRDVRKSMTYADAQTRWLAAEGYVLEFKFARTADNKPAKTVTVQKEDIAYDTAVVAVAVDGNNTIQSYTVYFFDYEMTYGDAPEIEDYRIKPVIIKAAATPLYSSLDGIVEYFKR